jgi:hypothetical protein
MPMPSASAADARTFQNLDFIRLTLPGAGFVPVAFVAAR